MSYSSERAQGAAQPLGAAATCHHAGIRPLLALSSFTMKCSASNVAFATAFAVALSASILLAAAQPVVLERLSQVYLPFEFTASGAPIFCLGEAAAEQLSYDVASQVLYVSGNKVSPHPPQFRPSAACGWRWQTHSEVAHVHERRARCVRPSSVSAFSQRVRKVRGCRAGCEATSWHYVHSAAARVRSIWFETLCRIQRESAARGTQECDRFWDYVGRMVQNVLLSQK